MLPDADNSPACPSQGLVVRTIALHVAIELGLPVADIGLRTRAVIWAAVPKTAVHEDRHPGRGEHDIGAAADSRPWRDNALTEAETTPMEFRAKSDLGSRVRRAIALHHGANRRARRSGCRWDRSTSVRRAHE